MRKITTLNAFCTFKLVLLTCFVVCQNFPSCVCLTQTRDYVNKEIRNESLKLNLLAALYTAMSRRREGLLILDDYNDIINFWKELRDPLFICMILSTIISFLWTLTFFPLHFLAYRKNVLEWRLGKPRFSTKQDVFDANTVKLYFGTTLSFYAFGLVLMSLLLSLMLMLLAWEPGREVLWMLRWWWGPMIVLWVFDTILNTLVNKNIKEDKTLVVVHPNKASFLDYSLSLAYLTRMLWNSLMRICWLIFFGFASFMRMDLTMFPSGEYINKNIISK